MSSYSVISCSEVNEDCTASLWSNTCRLDGNAIQYFAPDPVKEKYRKELIDGVRQCYWMVTSRIVFRFTLFEDSYDSRHFHYYLFCVFTVREEFRVDSIRTWNIRFDPGCWLLSSFSMRVE